MIDNAGVRTSAGIRWSLGLPRRLENRLAGPPLLEAAQPTKHLAPLKPDQHTGVIDPQTPD
jgi:hypothetical protein